MNTFYKEGSDELLLIYEKKLKELQNKKDTTSKKEQEELKEKIKNIKKLFVLVHLHKKNFSILLYIILCCNFAVQKVKINKNR